MHAQHYMYIFIYGMYIITLALRVYAVQCNWPLKRKENPSLKWNASICVYWKLVVSELRSQVSELSRRTKSVSHIVQRSIGDRISSVGRPIFSDWDARGLFNVCKIIRENIREKGLETTPIPKRNADVDRRHRFIFISKERERGAASRSRNEMTLFWDNNARANFSFFFTRFA